MMSDVEQTETNEMDIISMDAGDLNAPLETEAASAETPSSETSTTPTAPAAPVAPVIAQPTQQDNDASTAALNKLTSVIEQSQQTAQAIQAQAAQAAKPVPLDLKAAHQEIFAKQGQPLEFAKTPEGEIDPVASMLRLQAHSNQGLSDAMGKVEQAIGESRTQGHEEVRNWHQNEVVPKLTNAMVALTQRTADMSVATSLLLTQYGRFATQPDNFAEIQKQLGELYKFDNKGVCVYARDPQALAGKVTESLKAFFNQPSAEKSNNATGQPGTTQHGASDQLAPSTSSIPGQVKKFSSLSDTAKANVVMRQFGAEDEGMIDTSV